MDLYPCAEIQPLVTLPGVYPREMIEATLPLEAPETPEVGLLESWCPGIPTDGRSYKAHKLRVKVLTGDLVDVYCDHSCDPAILRAVIEDLYQDTE